jgi:Flp pilus assembly protein TadD
MSSGVVCLAAAPVLAGAPVAHAAEPPAVDTAALALRATTEMRWGHYADAETTWRRVIALREAEAAPPPALAAALDGLGPTFS